MLTGPVQDGPGSVTSTRGQLLPDVLAAEVARGARRGVIAGSVLALDIVGFTALTEELRAEGERGTERLGDILARAHVAIGQAVAEMGGSVVSISGDGVLVLCPGDEGRRASVTAAAIRDRLRDGTAGLRLDVRIGLARGEVGWTLFRSGDRAAYGLEGAAIVRANLAERAAGTGDILADEAIARGLPGAFGPKRGDGFAPLLDAPDAPEVPSLPPLVPLDDALYRALLPSGTAALNAPGEFREVVSAFIRLPEVISPQAREAVVTMILDLSAERGGVGCRLDQGIAGASFFLFWGAPVADEHDLDRAMGLLLALNDRSPVRLAIGASQGITFSGFMGTERYQDYTCLGATTNLAARLAQKAPEGSIWIDGALAGRLDGRVTLRPMGQFRPKGFDHDVTAHAVVGDLRPRVARTETPLVGRDGLCAELVARFGRLAEGKGAGGIILEGEAGIGKSHLAWRVIEDLPSEVRVLAAETSSVLRPSLGVAWALLRKAVPDRAALEALIAGVRGAAQAAALARSAPLLAEGLGFDWSDPPGPTLDAEVRSRLVRQGIVAALLAEAERQPLLLHIEDLQWLDDDSRAVVTSILQAANSRTSTSPIGILMTARPRDRHLPDDAKVEICRLERLNRDDIGNLIAARLNGVPSTRLQTVVAERSAGIPLFVTQLLRFLQDSGLIEAVEGVWHLVDGFEAQRLPTDARALLTSRIDRLPDAARRAVAITAVLERGATPRQVAAMAADEGTPLSDPQAALATAAAAQILTRDETGYGFVHALLRDAAYEVLLPSRRIRLHRIAAELLKAEGAAPDVLAMHYDRGEVRELAIACHLDAGRAARDRYQNEAAIWHFGRALDLLPEDNRRARFETAIALDKVFFRVSDHARQEPVLDLIDKLADGLGDRDRLIATLARVDYLSARTRHGEGVRLLDALIPVAEQFPGTRLAVRFYRSLAYAYNYADVPGRVRIGTDYARTAVEHARKTGDPEQIAEAIASEASFYRYRDDAKAERIYEEALKQTSDPVLTSRILHRLGSIAFRGGALDKGYQHYEDARDLAERTGDTDRKASLSLGLAFQAEREGDLGRAIAAYQDAIAAGRELNQYLLIAEAKRSLGTLAIQGGRLKEGEAILREISDEGGKDAAIVEGILGWLRMLEMNWDSAEEMISRFEAWSIATNFRTNLLWVWQARAIILALQSRFEEARDLLPECRAALAEFSDSDAYGQDRDRPAQLRSYQVTQAHIEGRIQLGLGDRAAAWTFADTAANGLASFGNSTALLDLTITGVLPDSDCFAFTHDLLARLGHPAADRVLVDAQRRINDLADRFEAAGYARDELWREHGYRAYLMERTPGQPGRALIEVLRDHGRAPASTNA